MRRLFSLHRLSSDAARAQALPAEEAEAVSGGGVSPSDRLHPLNGQMNAMRVRHYYDKLKLIIKTSAEEAAELDRSVLLVQRWCRGWLARRRLNTVRQQREEEQERRLLRELPGLVQGVAAKLDAVQLQVSGVTRPDHASGNTDDERLARLESAVAEQGELLRQVVGMLRARVGTEDGPSASTQRQQRWVDDREADGRGRGAAASP